MKKRKHNKNSIRFSFFRSMSMTSILFMIILFLGISVLFLKSSFQSESRNALQQLGYVSQQLQYYLDATENYSKTILSDDNVQNYMRDYLASRSSIPSTINVKQHIRQIIQSTPFIHSVSLYSEKGLLLLSTESNSSQVNLSDPDPIPLWTVTSKRHLMDSHQQVKVLSYVRPFYDINSGRMLGYVELAIPETQIAAIYQEHNSSDTIFFIDQNGYVQSSNGNPKLDSLYDHLDRIQTNLNSQYYFSDGNLLFFTQFAPLDWYVINQIPVISFLWPLFTMFCISLLIAALVMVLCIFASHHIAHKITYPLSYLISHIQTVKEGHWAPIQEIPCNNEVLSLFRSFNSMIDIQTKMKDDLIEAEKLKQQLSLNLLQQQVNPHFLYNTLDNICSLAELDEKETLIQLVMNLSSFYRSSLSNGKMQISIGQELEISRAYLEIMQIRYFGKFDFTITCPEELKSYSCIKLLFQPILENSIYHGIKGLSRHGSIQILAEDLGDSIRFTISDNGRGFSKECYEKIWQEDAGHFGLKSIQQRIQLYYGSPFGLSIESPDSGGCITIITLPKQEVAPCP
ncbi:MAG: histidine kinase [[Ruminococcus] gnavus]|nr:histidine kinase [Mediterraneibacter gnavus]